MRRSTRTRKEPERFTPEAVSLSDDSDLEALEEEEEDADEMDCDTEPLDVDEDEEDQEYTQGELEDEEEEDELEYVSLDEGEENNTVESSDDDAENEFEEDETDDETHYVLEELYVKYPQVPPDDWPLLLEDIRFVRDPKKSMDTYVREHMAHLRELEKDRLSEQEEEEKARARETRRLQRITDATKVVWRL